VLAGDHPVRLEEDKVPCGVVCSNGLPQWLWIVDALGFQPVWCLKSSECTVDLEWLRPAYPKLVFTTDIQCCPRVAAVFCDARPLKEVTEWNELQLLFLLRISRRLLAPGWNCFTEILRHSAVGGCTDSGAKAHVYSRSGSASLKSPAASVIPSCVHTVASDTVDSGRATAAPSLRRLPACDVVRVSKALHHGGGLHPSGMHPPQSYPTLVGAGAG
jgi:hypothetical protein